MLSQRLIHWWMTIINGQIQVTVIYHMTLVMQRRLMIALCKLPNNMTRVIMQIRVIMTILSRMLLIVWRMPNLIMIWVRLFQAFLTCKQSNKFIKMYMKHGITYITCWQMVNQLKHHHNHQARLHQAKHRHNLQLQTQFHHKAQRRMMLNHQVKTTEMVLPM